MFFIQSNDLIGQFEFSKHWDAGSTNLFNEIYTSVLSDDTLYYHALNVCNYTDTTFTICSVIGKLDRDGHVLVEKKINWLAPQKRKKTIGIDGQNLLVADGIRQNENASISLLILNKHDLDSIGHYSYNIGKPVDFYGISGVIGYKDYYIVSGWSKLVDEDIWPDWCLWINKETMLLDTITEYPFVKESIVPEYLFEDDKGDLVIYFSGIKNYIIPNGIALSSNGFIKYNDQKELVFFYKDTIETSDAHDYSHAALVQKNGNMIYKQPYDASEQGPFPTYTSDFDVLCIDADGDIQWRFNRPGWSPYARRSIFSLSETNDGDIIGCGYIEGHFNYPTLTEFDPFIDTLPPIPDSFHRYNAPYIIKLDGETGELEWQYALISLDENGHSGPFFLREMYELSDGSLMGAGAYTIRNDEGHYIGQDSWAVRIPSVGCLVEEMDCEFESYITATKDLYLLDMSDKKPFVLFPNPTSQKLYLKNNTKNLIPSYFIIRTLEGGESNKQKIKGNEIDLLNFNSKILFVDILDKYGNILQTEKIIKI